jgi:hypothetical protein
MRFSRENRLTLFLELLSYDQETEAAMAAAVSRKPIIRSILVNLNGAIGGLRRPCSTVCMSAFTDDTGRGRWVGTKTP